MTNNYWEKAVTSLPSFENEAKVFLYKLNIHVSNLKIDHLGMKFGTQEAVDKVADTLMRMGAELISSITMKNRIFRNYKLSSPLKFLGQEVWYVELPDSKPGVKRTRNGFEHLEFYFNEDIFTLEELEERFKELFPEAKGEYNLNLPNVEGQLPNPTIEFEKVGSEMEVKFHAKLIRDIIAG